jgi:Arc/MetJ family transcription regulator
MERNGHALRGAAREPLRAGELKRRQSGSKMHNLNERVDFIRSQIFKVSRKMTEN